MILSFNIANPRGMIHSCLLLKFVNIYLSMPLVGMLFVSLPPLPFPVNKFAINLTTLPLASHHVYSVPTNQFFPLKNKYSTCACAVSEPIASHTLLTEDDSLTISYLINSCGLSPESAISISNKVQFKTLDQPESVLTLLRQYGFTKTNILNLVRKRPNLLLADPQKSLLPKLNFLQSIGVSNSQIGKLLSRDPTFLARSLENQIIPNYNFLKSVLESDARVVASLRRTTWSFLEDPSKCLVPNINLLREFGVKESCLLLLLTHFPEALMRKPEEFREVVVKVLNLGFDPSKTTFVLAVHVLTGKTSKLVMDRCIKLYKKWGWSDNEIELAFKKHPNCMTISEKKLTTCLEFLVDKMGWESSEVARCSTVLFFSMEKRIVPRCCVLQVLESKGLLKKEDVSLNALLGPKEPEFLMKFVTKYEEQVPQLLDIYQRKVR